MALYRVKDYVDDASIDWIAQFHDVKAPGGQYLEKKDPFLYAENKITIKRDTVISLRNVSWKIFVNEDSDIELSESDLDSGVFEVGSDYYVYLCDNGANGTFKISANSTYPAGYTADTSRKIGGFHYGHIRKVSQDGLWIPVDSNHVKFGTAGTTTWKNNVTIGIVPNSVWDLKNRPESSPEGMVKIGSTWVDIYQASAAEAISLEDGVNGLHISAGKVQSKYGAAPVTGTEGLNWYGFAELASRSGKRMLDYNEWVQAAMGNPQGEDAADNYGWTKTTNTFRIRTGCKVNASTGLYDSVDGVKPYAISAYNVVDCVGNVWEWLNELIVRWDDTGGSPWGWKDVLGAGKGHLYSYYDNALVAMLAGASWGYGAFAGPRAASLRSRPWSVGTAIGVRLACDSL